jgi:hypothetical protein
MSKLRSPMIRDMQLAGLAEPTQRLYLRAVRQLRGRHPAYRLGICPAPRRTRSYGLEFLKLALFPAYAHTNHTPKFAFSRHVLASIRLTA